MKDEGLWIVSVDGVTQAGQYAGKTNRDAIGVWRDATGSVVPDERVTATPATPGRGRVSRTRSRRIREGVMDVRAGRTGTFTSTPRHGHANPVVRKRSSQARRKAFFTLFPDYPPEGYRRWDLSVEDLARPEIQAQVRDQLAGALARIEGDGYRSTDLRWRSAENIVQGGMDTSWAGHDFTRAHVEKHLAGLVQQKRLDLEQREKEGVLEFRRTKDLRAKKRGRG
jgi:hypothetical protein